jgi:hypothetical protein
VQSKEELHSSAVSAVRSQPEHSVLEQLAEPLHVAARCSAAVSAQSQLALQLSLVQAALPAAAQALASVESVVQRQYLVASQ